MRNALNPATVQAIDLVARHAAIAGLAVLLELYGRLLDATDDETFDDIDATIALHRAELFPLLDAARRPGAGGPLYDAAVELRRHLPVDDVPVGAAS